MRYDPALHHRRSLRLRGYDYSQTGAYFVTVCVQGRLSLFGEIMGEELPATPAGLMVEKWWRALPEKFARVETDLSAVMPNHFHGIVIITQPVGADPCVRPGRPDPCVRPGRPVSAIALPTLMQWFKTMTTNEYIRCVNERGWTPFAGRLWQRGYYEHVIRDERELEYVRRYVVDNPAKWAADRENPAAREPAVGRTNPSGRTHGSALTHVSAATSRW